jgi:hypothetical protein
MRRLIVLAVAVGALSGCSLSPSADFLAALGKDPATVCVQINTIYGTVRFARTAIVDGNVACNGDGLTLKSNGAQVGVPITIVPQVSVGAPTTPK